MEYSFNIMNWNSSDIQRMNGKTQNLCNINKMQHPKAGCLSARKENGRKFVQLELSYKTDTAGL